MRTLLTNGSVYSPADPHATAIAFDDGVVTWLGDDTSAASYATGADEVIDLRGQARRRRPSSTPTSTRRRPARC